MPWVEDEAGRIAHLPAVARGGPFQHKWALDEGGQAVCRVCGYRSTLDGGSLGCPWQVDMATLRDDRPVSPPGALERTAAALKAIWAADKARVEQEGSD